MLVDVQTSLNSLDTQEATTWCEEELGDVQLGDKRLDRRMVDTATKLAAHPTVPINQACDDWADTKASYRLFKNDSVTPAKILLAHQVRTRERMRSHPLVLAVQDTTYFNYTSHPKTKGLGPIGTKKQDLCGLIAHSTLALTPMGLPLGLLTQETWARSDEEAEMTEAERKQRPIEEKESHKWLKALQETTKLTPEGVKVVSVCDREADVYELFALAYELETGLLVRAAQNRALTDGNKLWDKAEAAPVAGYLKVEVPAKDDEPAREAIVSVRFCSVELKPPWRPKRTDREPLSPITLV